MTKKICSVLLAFVFAMHTAVSGSFFCECYLTLCEELFYIMGHFVLQYRSEGWVPSPALPGVFQFTRRK